MIAATIDDHYERIRDDLVSRGLTYDRLIDDVLDHVCCMVEEFMSNGNDFETSYDQVLETIGEKRLPEIQHQTLLNLDKKFQRMKNFTYVFGLTSAIVTIVGSLFKKMHWPGAGILITVGMMLIVFVFLPLYFITNHKEQVERKNPVYAIVGYLTIALLLVGAVFKIQHWPGANMVIYASIGFLLIGFVPLYVVNAFQKSGKEKANLPYIVMLLVGISIVMLFSNVNMSKNVLDTYMEEAIANEHRVEEVQLRTTKLINWAQDSAYQDKLQTITKIHDQARGLQVMIAEMQEGMKVFVNESGTPIADLMAKDNRGAGREAIVDNGSGHNFAVESKKLREMLLELIKDPVTKTQVEDHLEFTSKVMPFEYGVKDVENDPLIKNYFKLTDASKGIALSEYVSIAYLLHN